MAEMFDFEELKASLPKLRGLFAEMDKPSNEDRREALTSGLFSLAAGVLGGAGGGRQAPDPWGGLSRGIMGATQSYNDTLKQKRRDPAQDMAVLSGMVSLQKGMQDAKLADERRKAYKEIALGQRAPMQTTDYAPGESPQPFAGAAPPAPQQAPQAQPGSPEGSDTYGYLMNFARQLENKGLIEDAIKRREEAEKYRPELREQSTLTHNGKRVRVNVFKDGRMQVVPFEPDAEKLSFHDTGGGVQGLDPFTGAPVGSAIPKSVTPDANLSDVRSREQFGMSEQRQRDAMKQADRHFNASQGQSERHFQANLNQPQVVETGDGFALVNKQSRTATPIEKPDGSMLEKVKDMPSEFQNALMKNTQLGTKITTAGRLLNGEKVGDLQGDPKAIGPAIGRFPEAANIVDKKGVATRAAVADIGSQVIFNRSGAAVSVGEFERTKPFIPLATDTPEAARTKLKQLHQAIDQENRALIENAKRQGFKTPKTDQKADPLNLRQSDPLGLR